MHMCVCVLYVTVCVPVCPVWPEEDTVQSEVKGAPCWWLSFFSVTHRARMGAAVG